MNPTKKGINYLRQRGVDVDSSRQVLNGQTYEELKKTWRLLATAHGTSTKLPPGGKAGLIDALIVHTQRRTFTPKQRKRMGLAA